MQNLINEMENDEKLKYEREKFNYFGRLERCPTIHNNSKQLIYRIDSINADDFQNNDTFVKNIDDDYETSQKLAIEKVISI